MTITKVSQTECRDGKIITTDGDYLLQVAGPIKTTGVFNTMFAKGTWGGATFTYKAAPDSGVSGFPISNGALNDDGFVSLQVKSQGGILLTVTGSTGTTSVKVWAV